MKSTLTNFWFFAFSPSFSSSFLLVIRYGDGSGSQINITKFECERIDFLCIVLVQHITYLRFCIWRRLKMESKQPSKQQQQQQKSNDERFLLHFNCRSVHLATTQCRHRHHFLFFVTFSRIYGGLRVVCAHPSTEISSQICYLHTAADVGSILLQRPPSFASLHS